MRKNSDKNIKAYMLGEGGGRGGATVQGSIIHRGIDLGGIVWEGIDQGWNGGGGVKLSGGGGGRN